MKHLTSSLLGSDENKRDTKLKINSLIREIDYCIAVIRLVKIWTKSLKLKYQLQIRVYPLTVELNQEEGLKRFKKN
jgi:hypothetical protein